MEDDVQHVFLAAPLAEAKVRSSTCWVAYQQPPSLNATEKLKNQSVLMPGQ